ncbi:MAG: S8 family serine peptidase, partial [Bacteroidia bacterium]|nr:S8 family serine peptidase [Bacteroidia bacterium]
MKRTLLFLATLFFSVSLMAQSSEIENDEDGDPLYFKDQFIVSFNPVFMNLTAIDDTLVQEGPLSDFVNLDTLQLLIDSGYLDTTGFFNTYVDFSLLTAHKVFKRLTSQITYSITRLGDTIEMPKFWATLLIEWPNDALITPPQACDSLNTFYPLIQHAELNWVAKVDGAPNDTRYSADQASLHNTASHSNAHINIESAWDVEVGRDYVKVGVFDTGIRWAHEDFGDGTFAGSKIADGFDYVNWQHVSQTTSYTNAHGTQCAGIIGALRNNNLGVSGIAGGDGANSNPGVSLYSMKVLNGSGLGYASTVADAMVEGVSWNPSQNYGYGLHI